MKNILAITVLILLTFSSCGTYNLSTSYKIKSILTITEKGDTLAVPVRDFKFRILRQDDPFRYQYRQDWQYRYITTDVIHGNNNIRRRVHLVPRNISTKPITTPVKPIRIVTPVAIPSIKIKNNHPNSKKN
jgi:hypothetical protein